jgi:hypothetical protein
MKNASADVGELAIAEQRPGMAQVAAAAADEQLQPALAPPGSAPPPPRRHAPARRGSGRRAWRRHQAADEGTQRLGGQHQQRLVVVRRRRAESCAASGRPARHRRPAGGAGAPGGWPVRAGPAAGRSACDHRLSAAPSQPHQRWCTAFHSDGALRSSSSSPPRQTAHALAAVGEGQAASGRWQLAQAVTISICPGKVPALPHAQLEAAKDSSRTAASAIDRPRPA